MLPAKTISWAEIKARGLKVKFDWIDPADRVTICVNQVAFVDDLPPIVRRAVHEADWALPVRWVVSWIDNGVPPERVVAEIKRRSDAFSASLRSKGLLAPAEGRATP